MNIVDIGITATVFIGVNFVIWSIDRKLQFPSSVLILLLTAVNASCVGIVLFLLGIPISHPIMILSVLSGALLGLQGGSVVVRYRNFELRKGDNNANPPDN